MRRSCCNFLSNRRALAATFSLVALATACGDGDEAPELAVAGSGGLVGTGAAPAGGFGAGGFATGGSAATGGFVPATGGAATGGFATGGLATGGFATGGSAATGGFVPETGGAFTGGASTGGAATGGAATGGAETGGAETGGLATGGTSSGGFAGSGGSVETGGATSGGVETGGVETGGASPAGGAGTGGVGTGGVGTGGVGTGGAGTGGGSTTDCEGETSGLSASAIFHVSPSGSATGDGQSFATAMNFATAVAAVAPGEMILLEPGTYTIPYTAGVGNTITLAKSGANGAPIMLVAAHCGRAVFDFSFPEQAWVQDSYGFFVTGDYWTFEGIDVTRAGYQGAYVTGQHHTFENCAFYDNRNTGLEINKGGAYTTVINSDAYRNYDPKKLGGMADGFAPKQTQGPGNVLIGCRAWENSDDGFDTFDSPEVVVIEDSWAFRNGVDVWGYGGFDGNGNGFKLGGNAKVAHNRITNSVAFGNRVKGFDQNNNAGGLTILNCTGYANGTNFGLGNPVSSGEVHFLRNNVSLGATDSFANADAQYNSWNAGFGVAAADFVSLDLSQATVDRNPDGTLPETSLFRLTATSELIDAGTDVGLPYAGGAPDLGAFERASP